jgi:hypothetical protein
MESSDLLRIEESRGYAATVILRLSQELARRVKASRLVDLPQADDPLTDWTARTFTISRTRYIVACNTKSLYSTVLYARGINDAHTLIVRTLKSIREIMEDDGLSFTYAQRIAPSTGEVRFGKAISRSVTGSMNELEAMAKLLLTDEDLSPFDVSLRLNGTLLSILGGFDGQSCGMPREAVRALLKT